VTQRIDLMPRTCREVLGRRVWLRRWAGVYALVIVGLIAGLWYASGHTSRLASRRDALTDTREIRWAQNEQAQALHAEIESLRRRIERYNRLAWPVRVSEVIDTIAGVVPEGTTFLSLSATERVERPSRRRASNGASEEPPEPRSILITEFEGVARDDAAVASIVSGLQGIALFRSVVLDYARNATVDGIGARTFRITCEIDLSRKYRFEEVAGVTDGQ